MIKLLLKDTEIKWIIMDCHWFNINHCRSCELLDHTYQETLALKEKKLRELFLETPLFEKPTVGLNQKVSGSRNKAKLAVFGELPSNIQFGFYDNAQKFKSLEECPLHMEGLNELLPILKMKLLESNIIPYSLASKKGELKYVILSKSQSHGEFLIRFVLRSKESLDRLKKMAKILREEIPAVKVVTANIQPEHKAILEGDEEIVLSEEATIVHRFGAIELTLGPRSFFQVTPEIASSLYHTVGEMLKNKKLNSFLDLYCGVGAFSFFAAQSCPDVLGVEISKEAIVCANSSLKLNSVLGKINFRALDVEEFLKTLNEKYEAILVNPPRRGLNAGIIKSLMAQKPKLIIYSSCNAETLYRDYKNMEADYEISQTQIFDMFPFTEHFETLMILNRRDA